MLALYDICAGDSHRLIIVKAISACECHLHKGIANMLIRLQLHIRTG